MNTDDAEVRCPFAEYQCNSIITEREIRGVSEQTQHMYVCMYCTGLPLVAIHDNTLLPHTVQPAVGPPHASRLAALVFVEGLLDYVRVG